jgi:hypothetical protein
MIEPDDTTNTDYEIEENEILILNYVDSIEEDFITTNYSQESWGDC